LTDNTYEDWAPVWTPDKSQIVFHSDRDGFYGIYMMDRDGSNVRLVSPEGRQSQFPTVSPDGQFVAFEMYMGNNNWDIFVKALNSNAMQQITFSPAREGGAAFSPDGTQIGYHSTQASNAELGYDIYVVNLDGTGTQRMTNFPETMDVWPQWSPDGSQMIFQSERGGDSEIFIMNADGSNQRNLSNNPALDRVPRFTPDGNRIVFRSERNGDSEIFIMNINGRNPQALTNNDLRDMHPDS
jgi:Tol biopolymer transport system component